MAGSGAKRYAAVDDTRAFLKSEKASSILANMTANAYGEMGTSWDGPEFIETHPDRPALLEEVQASEGASTITPEMIQAQHQRLNMTDQEVTGTSDATLLPVSGETGGLLEPVGNVVPLFGNKGQAAQLPFGKNLIDQMDDAKLTEMGERVIQTYGIDNGSRQEWLDGHDKALELVDYQKKAKAYPIERASNIKYPLLMMSSLQFAARAYPAIVRPGNMVRMKIEGHEPVAPAPEEIEAMVEAAKADPSVEEKLDFLMRKSKKAERANRVSTYLSWQLRSQIANWEDETDQLLHKLPLVGCAFRKVYTCGATGKKKAMLVGADKVVINMTARSVEEAPRISECFDVYPYQLEAKILAGEWADIRQKIGYAPEHEIDNQKPIEFIEQHCRLDLDGDGYSEPIVVICHKDTGTVARIELNYDKEDVKQDGNGRTVAIEPLQIYCKYDFLPNPRGGIYGVGFGHILRDVVDGINTTFNQIFDAAHLQNSSGGFMAKGTRIGRGEQGDKLHVSQNRYHYVNSTGGDLRNSIVPFEHKGPSAVLFEVLGMLVDSGKELASIKDVLTGDTGSSTNLPVGTTLALIEQGLQVFSAIYKRIFRAMNKEFNVLFRLNHKDLKFDQYREVVDDLEASVDDFEPDDFDIVPFADPNAVTNMQKLGRAQFLQQFLEDPMLNKKEIYTRLFEATGIDNQERLFAPPDTVAQQMQEISVRTADAVARKEAADAELKLAQSQKALAEAGATAVALDQKDRELDQKDEDLNLKADDIAVKREAAKAKEKSNAQPSN